MTNPECVISDSIITPVGSDSVVREDIPVAIEDLGVAILVDGYDVCLYTYNFTIVATTLTGELRTTVSQDVPTDLSGTIINPQRMRKGYSTHCVCLCVCVSLLTLEATLIYSTNNGYHWTAFIFNKMKTCKSAPSIQKQLSKLTALYAC